VLGSPPAGAVSLPCGCPLSSAPSPSDAHLNWQPLQTTQPGKPPGCLPPSPRFTKSFRLCDVPKQNQTFFSLSCSSDLSN
jgi:hypothetical protein